MTTQGKRASGEARWGTAARLVLDEEPYRGMLARTRDQASMALARYGQPRMSVQELREVTMDLAGSLSDAVVAERRAGW